MWFLCILNETGETSGAAKKKKDPTSSKDKQAKVGHLLSIFACKSIYSFIYLCLHYR